MAIVARFRDLAGAEVASASLEAAGIMNVLADAQTIGVAWSYSTALGGIGVHVSDSDVEKAREVLESPTTVEWPDLPAGSRDEQCWVCGQYALELQSGPRKTLAVMTAVGFPLWFWRSRLRCQSCGASRRVPLQVRPELALAWVLVGMGVTTVCVALMLVAGYAMYGRRA